MCKGRGGTRDEESGVRETDGTRSISFNPGAAAFLRSVLPGGVACGAGEFCCLRYSWRVRLRAERREEEELWTEWCGEWTGVAESAARIRGE
jgi:hypothetical protein